VVSPWLAGDYNQNGIVDAADYVVWRKTLGQVGANLAADGNYNGQIDPGDSDVWRMRFGGHAVATSTATAIPESPTLMLAAMATVAGTPRKWHSRQVVLNQTKDGFCAMRPATLVTAFRR
jgi:hypothetical protein